MKIGNGGNWFWRNAGADGFDVKVTDWNTFKNVWGYQRQPSNPWECFFWASEDVYGVRYWFATSCSRKRGFICQF